MERYHPLLVALHWLMAVLIVMTLLSGGIAPLDVHLTSGALIAALLLLRIVVKLTTRAPRLTAGEGGFHTRMARWMHLALYGLVVTVVGTGLGIAAHAGLYQVMRGEAQLPADFSQSPIYTAHVLCTDVLLAAIAGHVIAALWHQLVKRDHLLSRMWFDRTSARNQWLG